MNRHILEIYFHLNNNLRKLKEILCNTQSTLKKSWVEPFGSFFGLLLCTFYFIYQIVPVQYIVQIYAEQHTGAGCESLNERRSRRSYCVMKSLMLCIK